MEPLAPSTNGATPPEIRLVSMADWCVETEEDKESTDIIHRILPAAVFTMASGHPKTGKTITEYQKSICVATGKDFLGTFPVLNPTPVIYIQTEGSRRNSRDRFRRQCKGLELNPKDVPVWMQFCPPKFRLDDNDCLKQMVRDINSIHAGVVMIDMISSCWFGKPTDPKEVRLLCARLIQMVVNETGVTLELLNHAHQTNEYTMNAPPGMRMLGTVSWWGAYEVGMHLSRKNTENETTIEFDGRLDEPVPDVKAKLELDGDVMRLVGRTSATQAKAKADKAMTPKELVPFLLDNLLDAGSDGRQKSGLCRALNVTTQVVDEVLALAENTGQVFVTNEYRPEGRYKTPTYKPIYRHMRHVQSNLSVVQTDE